MHNGTETDSGSPYPEEATALSLKEALAREATVRGGDDPDNTDNTDIEDGDGQGGSGSPGH